MPLPDASRLSALRSREWDALGQRLREIGLTHEGAAGVAQVGPALSEPMRLPLQHWHLRRSSDPASLAMRMLMFGDPVTPRQARAALGDVPIEPLVDAGFLVVRRERLVSPFYLNVVNDLYVVCDDLGHGGDAVMGAGQTTADLCQASYPNRPIERMLDLGCGAGTAALLFSPRATRCLGVDINPRAITLSRVNAALNGIDGVEFREGDLFEPVGDQTFELIVSQPPFVPLPAGVESATFLHGGRRGDELPARLFAGLRDHLSARARAVVLVEWPLLEAQPLERRIREMLAAPNLSVLLLQFPGTDLDDYSARYAAARHPSLGGAFEREARVLRNHLERMGIRRLQLTLTIVHRHDGAPAWTAVVDVPRASVRTVTSARIDKLVAARDLLAGPDEALLGATLRVPDGVLSIERPVSDPTHETVRLQLSDGALAHSTELNADASLLLSLAHSTADVRGAVAAFAENRGLDPDTASEKILAGIRDALSKGLLELSDGQG